MNKLSETEQEIMILIWQKKGEVTAALLLEELEERREWKRTSVLTFLARLVQKGYLACEKQGRVNYYRPLISYEEYSARESKNILQKMYGNSVRNFVTALYDAEVPSRQELDELYAFIEEKRKEAKGEV